MIAEILLLVLVAAPVHAHNSKFFLHQLLLILDQVHSPKGESLLVAKCGDMCAQQLSDLAKRTVQPKCMLFVP